MGTHYSGNPQEILALDTYIKVTRAAESVTQRINHHLADYNLTLSQFGALESLYHLGPMPASLLAEKVLKSNANMTLVIDNLMKRSLVTRERDPQDRRRVIIQLTTDGETLIRSIFPKHVQIVVSEFKILTEAQQQTLGILCKILGTNQPINN